MKSYHPEDPKLIGNWFDINNVEHLKAWQELQELGYWPQWFQNLWEKDGVETHLHWTLVIQCKMAEAWVTKRLGNNSE